MILYIDLVIPGCLNIIIPRSFDIDCHFLTVFNCSNSSSASMFIGYEDIVDSKDE